MYKITKSGYLKVIQELNKIQEQLLPEVVIRIQEARKNGDFSENAELHEELKLKKRLEARVVLLIDVANNSEVINIDDIADKSIIQFGASVILVDENNNEIQYHIVGPAEASLKENKVSYKSPIAQKLIGSKVGTTIQLNKVYNIKNCNYNCLITEQE